MNDVKRLIFKVEGLKKSYGSIDALNIKKLDIRGCRFARIRKNNAAGSPFWIYEALFRKLDF